MNISQNINKHNWLRVRTILAAKNVDIDTLIAHTQNNVPGDFQTYLSIDTVMDENAAVNYPTEFLNSLDLPGLPQHILELKILLHNINPPPLCNGTRFAVKKLMTNVIEATILDGKFKGEDVLLDTYI